LNKYVSSQIQTSCLYLYSILKANMLKKGIILCFLALSTVLYSCDEGDGGPIGQDSKYKPILLDTISLFKSISFGPLKDINNPGKVYVDNVDLFVVEQYAGVHFFDNTNPSNPIQTGFLSVPGCLDMSVSGNVMYLNNAQDMVAIDISNPKNPVVTRRIRNAYAKPGTPDGAELTNVYAKIPDNTVIVGWERIPI
jgi:hypothetical protein